MGQTWNLNPIHDGGNIISDIGGFFSGPPGDPGRIRQVAAQVDALRGQYDGDVSALNGAVTTLTSEWTGDGASAFAQTWNGGGTQQAPAQVMAKLSSALEQYANGLRTYADQLEHAQHEHWLMIGVLVALTIVNVAQLGADPATDAAEVGAGAAMEVGASFALPSIATFAIEGAFVGFGSDVIAQLGADLWDHLDSGFVQSNTGPGAVQLFNASEAAQSALGGAVSFGLAGGMGALASQFGGRLFSNLLENPLTRTFTVGAFSGATDAAGQLITTGHVDWGEVVVNAGIGGMTANLLMEHGMSNPALDPMSLQDPNLPRLADVMGQDRYDRYLADIQQIKAANPELARIPEEDLVAIRGYTSAEKIGGLSDYQRINAALRSGDPQQIAALRPYIDHIESGLSQLPDYHGTVYRGTNLPAAAVQAYREAALQGTAIPERAFTSTTVDAGVAASGPFGSGNTQFVIESVHGKDISAISVFDGTTGVPEREVLFAPGSQFEVLEVSEPAPGNFEIIMAQVP